MIIPRKAHFKDLLVTDAHVQTWHGGIQLTLAYLRTNYWIINGKNSVKPIIKRCITCYRYRTKSGNQLMGQLPEARITVSRPFTNVGVDFAGPLTIKVSAVRGTRTTKAYVSVFVCMSAKAIHLEAVCDLSAFIAAYRRFAGRRGAAGNNVTWNAMAFHPAGFPTLWWFVGSRG